MTAEQYLINHGLNVEYVTKTFMWQLDDQNKRIIIPVYDEKEKGLWNRYRYLDGRDNKFESDPGAKVCLYPMYEIEKNNVLVFCEGEPDCVKLWQEGIPAVTIQGVNNMNQGLAEKLSGKLIYLCLDTDEAGRKEVKKYCQLLEKNGCSVLILRLPKESKDICEYFQSGKTKQDFEGLMQTSISPEQELVEEFSKLYPILDNQTFTNTTYPKTKWLIDKLVRVGGISFLVGESGTGKTIASLSIAKAVSEGSMLLDKFQAEQMKVLIIDKENTPADIQKLFKTMKIKNDNIFNFFTEESYNLIDDKGEPTEIANYFSLFVKQNDIGLVILDSAIDFLIGEESSSGDVATNINKWRDIFAPASILTIHHNKKADPRNKIKAADMMRGSGVWLSSAQSVLALSTMSIDHPERLMVEHAKVRGGAKQKPFEMDMIIRKDPAHEGETIVDGYKFIKEVEEVKLKLDEAKEAVAKFLYDNPNSEYSTAENTPTSSLSTIDINFSLFCRRISFDGWNIRIGLLS